MTNKNLHSLSTRVVKAQQSLYALEQQEEVDAETKLKAKNALTAAKREQRIFIYGRKRLTPKGTLVHI